MCFKMMNPVIWIFAFPGPGLFYHIFGLMSSIDEEEFTDKSMP